MLGMVSLFFVGCRMNAFCSYLCLCPSFPEKIS
jgi:hypothetical protein